MITVISSVGKIFINDEGYPVLESLPYEYTDIVKFDIPRLERMCSSNHVQLRDTWNILVLGYWLDNGDYIPPISQYAEHECMQHIWSGCVTDFDDVFELEDEGRDECDRLEGFP